MSDRTACKQCGEVCYATQGGFCSEHCIAAYAAEKQGVNTQLVNNCNEWRSRCTELEKELVALRRESVGQGSGNDDFDLWITSTFVIECSRGENIPHIAVKPIQHTTNITPKQAGCLIGHLARLVGDIPIGMMFEHFKG